MSVACLVPGALCGVRTWQGEFVALAMAADGALQLLTSGTASGPLIGHPVRALLGCGAAREDADDAMSPLTVFFVADGVPLADCTVSIAVDVRELVPFTTAPRPRINFGQQRFGLTAQNDANTRLA